MGQILSKAGELYLKAMSSDQRSDWTRCAIYYEVYLAMGGQENVHPCLNLALSKIDMVVEALASCHLGLKMEPDNPFLLHNKAIYEKHLGIPSQETAGVEN